MLEICTDLSLLFYQRMVFRAEADYNKLSGVQRAKWMKTIHIDP